MLQSVSIFILCLVFSFSSLADGTRNPASAAGKSAAMKYILGRKPAQEQMLTSSAKMRDALVELYAALDENIPNTAKLDLIHEKWLLLGYSLGYILDHTTANDVTERHMAHKYHNTIIFLHELTLAKTGEWDQITCSHTYTLAKMDDNAENASVERPPTSETESQQAANDPLRPITTEIRILCKGK